MFDVFPGWVGDTIALVAFVAGPGGVVWLFLSNRQANHKLKVDELDSEANREINRGSLTVEQFNAALPAYKDLLDRSNSDRDEAVEALKECKTQVAELCNKQERLVGLFLRVVARTDIQLTEEEREELEKIRPSYPH